MGPWLRVSSDRLYEWGIRLGTPAYTRGGVVFPIYFGGSFLLMYLFKTYLSKLIFTIFSVVGGASVLTLCMLGNFSCYCCGLLTFFKINVFKTLSKCLAVRFQADQGLDLRPYSLQ